MLGPSDPDWFFYLAVAWLIAGGIGISLIWIHSLTVKMSCIQTGAILVMTAMAIWLNLEAIRQIMYVA